MEKLNNKDYENVKNIVSIDRSIKNSLLTKKNGGVITKKS